MGLRQCLLDELQPASQPSDNPENNTTYDENLHSAMVTFWDLFTGIFTQEITCTQCNSVRTTEIPFRELMLNFPEEHHPSNLDCTLEQLINHHYGQKEINDYQCNDCTRKTTARQCTFIHQFPKILCIHLDRKKPDGTIICSPIAYPVHGNPVICLKLSQKDVGSQYDLIGTVHQKAGKRGNSCHYTAVCKSGATKDWYKYDDHQVNVETFVSRRSENVLRRFQNSTSMLFYVKKAALPVNPNNDLTSDIGEDDHSYSSSTNINTSYNVRYGSADASSELNVAEKSPSTTFETFKQRRAILSQAFLQRSQGHYCTICQEQHYLLSTDLATFKTDANCTHIYCYAKLSCMMNRQSDNLKCPDCQCIASNIILHQPIRLNDAYAYNENIPQHVLGSHEGHTCSICHETYSLRDNDLGTFESKGKCNHIFCYECLSHYKNNHGPGRLKCPNCRIEAYDIVRNERRTTSPETIEMSMDDQSVFCDWAMGTMSDTGINNRHEERCICHSYHIQLRQCEHEGCNKRVHQLCQDDWLERHDYPHEDKYYCPQHNMHYVKWVRFKAGEIPPWDIGCDNTVYPSIYTMVNGSAIHDFII